jgi:hypothetical protein
MILEQRTISLIDQEAKILSAVVEGRGEEYIILSLIYDSTSKPQSNFHYKG